MPVWGDDFDGLLPWSCADSKASNPFSKPKEPEAGASAVAPTPASTAPTADALAEPIKSAPRASSPSKATAAASAEDSSGKGAVAAPVSMHRRSPSACGFVPSLGSLTWAVTLAAEASDAAAEGPTRGGGPGNGGSRRRLRRPIFRQDLRGQRGQPVQRGKLPACALGSTKRLRLHVTAATLRGAACQAPRAASNPFAKPAAKASVGFSVVAPVVSRRRLCARRAPWLVHRGTRLALPPGVRCGFDPAVCCRRSEKGKPSGKGTLPRAPAIWTS